jgi:hypothetical protein
MPPFALILAFGATLGSAQPANPAVLPASFSGAAMVKVARDFRVECSINHENPPAGFLDYLVIEGTSTTGASVQVLRATPDRKALAQRLRQEQLKQGDRCGEPSFSKREGRRKVVSRTDCLDQQAGRAIDTSIYLVDLPQLPSGIAVITVWFKRGERAPGDKLLADLVRSLTIVPYRPGLHGPGKE